MRVISLEMTKHRELPSSVNFALVGSFQCYGLVVSESTRPCILWAPDAEQSRDL